LDCDWDSRGGEPHRYLGDSHPPDDRKILGENENTSKEKNKL
jgi:hypothetical protein